MSPVLRSGTGLVVSDASMALLCKICSGLCKLVKSSENPYKEVRGK